jgi:hypothetical protein
MPSARIKAFFAYFLLPLRQKVRRLAGRDPPILTLIYSYWKLSHRRVGTRQPGSFSLYEPQRKRTKRNGSPAAGIFWRRESLLFFSLRCHQYVTVFVEKRAGPYGFGPLQVDTFSG